MKLKATASFAGLRGNRAYNEVFEVSDEEGMALLVENYPIEVVEGPEQEDGSTETEPPADGEEQEDGSTETEPPADGEEDSDGEGNEPKPKGSSGRKRSAKGDGAQASKA